MDHSSENILMAGNQKMIKTILIEELVSSIKASIVDGLEAV